MVSRDENAGLHFPVLAAISIATLGARKSWFFGGGRRCHAASEG